MCRKNYKLDVVSHTLTITREFEEKMMTPDTDEYILFKRFQEDIPNLVIVRRTHRSPRTYTNKQGEKFHCNQFKNLTYKNMENFIKAIPNSEAYLNEYKFMKDYAAKIQTNAYTLVRNWFMKQFPEFRTNPMFYIVKSPVVVPAKDVIKEKQADKEEPKIA